MCDSTRSLGGPFVSMNLTRPLSAAGLDSRSRNTSLPSKYATPQPSLWGPSCPPRLASASREKPTVVGYRLDIANNSHMVLSSQVFRVSYDPTDKEINTRSASTTVN